MKTLTFAIALLLCSHIRASTTGLEDIEENLEEISQDSLSILDWPRNQPAPIMDEESSEEPNQDSHSILERSALLDALRNQQASNADNEGTVNYHYNCRSFSMCSPFFRQYSWLCHFPNWWFSLVWGLENWNLSSKWAGIVWAFSQGGCFTRRDFEMTWIAQTWTNLD